MNTAIKLVLAAILIYAGYTFTRPAQRQGADMPNFPVLDIPTPEQVEAEEARREKAAEEQRLKWVADTRRHKAEDAAYNAAVAKAMKDRRRKPGHDNTFCEKCDRFFRAGAEFTIGRTEDQVRANRMKVHCPECDAWSIFFKP